MLAHHLPSLRDKCIILASQSPRRAELLKLAGLNFIPIKSNFNEDLPKNDFDSPSAYCIATAHGKAKDVMDNFRGDENSSSGYQTNNGNNGTTHSSSKPDLVIGSDTIVVESGSIYEKPSSEAHAFQMLRKLSGQQHSVITAVSLITASGAVREIVSESLVWFDDLSDDLIQAYVRTGEPMDKAGAYGIQGMGGSFVSRIEGCYFTIMGLPLHALTKEIHNLIHDGLL